MFRLLKDETGGVAVQWLVLIVVSGIIGVLILGTLLEPIREAYTAITERSTDIMSSGF